MDTLEPFTPTVSYLPAQRPGDVQVTIGGTSATSTKDAPFDWKKWAAILAGAYALYLLAKSMKRAARHG